MIWTLFTTVVGLIGAFILKSENNANKIEEFVVETQIQKANFSKEVSILVT